MRKQSFHILLSLLLLCTGCLSAHADNRVKIRTSSGTTVRLTFYSDDIVRVTKYARRGSYPGMLQHRTFRLRLHSKDGSVREQTVNYDGAQQTVSL